MLDEWWFRQLAYECGWLDSTIDMHPVFSPRWRVNSTARTSLCLISRESTLMSLQCFLNLSVSYLHFHVDSRTVTHTILLPPLSPDSRANAIERRGAWLTWHQGLSLRYPIVHRWSQRSFVHLIFFKSSIAIAKKNRLSIISHVLLSSMLLFSTLLLSTLTYAQQQTSLYSTSFGPCCSNCTQFTTSAFNVSLAPSNRTLTYQLSGESTFEGQTSLTTTIFQDGNRVLYQSTSDPCVTPALPQLCPIASGSLNVSVNQELPQKALDALPDDVLTTPGLNLSMALYLYDVRGNRGFGCVQANLTNGVAQMSSGNATTTTSGSAGSETSSTSTSGTSGTSTPTSESSARRTSFSWRSLL